MQENRQARWSKVQKDNALAQNLTLALEKALAEGKALPADMPTVAEVS